MKRVFVCSPYAGDIPWNTAQAVSYCMNEIDAGNAPFAPHLLYPNIIGERDPAKRALGIKMGLKMMDVCDELHVYGARVSSGMEVEIMHWIAMQYLSATVRPKPVFYSLAAYTDFISRNPSAEKEVTLYGDVSLSGMREDCRATCDPSRPPDAAVL